MSAVRSILGNTLARGITELINRVGGALFWIMVARHFGASGLGILAYAMSMFSLFSTMSTLGLGSVAVRDIARKKSEAGIYFGQGLKLGLLLSFIFALIMILTGLLLHPGADTRFAIMSMAVAMIPTSGFYWSKSILMAAEKMSWIALARSWENGFKLAFGLIMIVTGGGIREMVLVLVLSKIVSFVVCFRYAADKVVHPVWRPVKPLMNYFLKQVPSFSLINLFNSLFWALPVILITSLHGEAQAGIFSAAFKLVEMVIAMGLAYGGAFFPVISRYADNPGSRFAELIGKSIKYISIITLAIAGYTQIIAPQIIGFLYGPDMMQAVPVMKMLVWLVPPFGIIPVIAFSLISRNLQRYDLAANAAGTLALLVLGAALVPVSGAFGMAISLVIAGFVFLAFELFGLLHHFYRPVDVLEWLKPVPGLLLIWCVSFILRDYQIWIPMFSSAVLYVVYLWLSRTITQPEIIYLKNSIFVR